MRLAQVDAFTDRPFSGNPAAVCLVEPSETPDVGWMQQLAAEMDLAATCFVQPESGGFGLRWFSPTIELELCGHGTLAAAHVLFERGRVPGDTVSFRTRAGVLTARRLAEGIELELPAEPAVPVDAPAGLPEALRVEPSYVGRSRLDLLVEIGSERQVLRLAPDMRRIRSLDARGVIITARSDGGAYDFVSRFFAPRSGIDEDAATGSAHCSLGPFWAERLGKAELRAYQASRRGGRMLVRTAGERILLVGRAVTVWTGDLRAW